MNEGQGQYNLHMMHFYVRGSHRAKFDNNFNSFQGIACEGHTQTQMNTHTHGQTLASSTLTFSKSERLKTKRKKAPKTKINEETDKITIHTENKTKQENLLHDLE